MHQESDQSAARLLFAAAFIALSPCAVAPTHCRLVAAEPAGKTTSESVAREDAASQKSKSNMKQILRAFIDYEEKTRKFPSNIKGKDGKALLSWRVAILPELGQNATYFSFRRDEPWDSEHNLNLLKQMPAIFRHPEDDADSTSSSYYKPTGLLAFGRRDGDIRVTDIADGTSKTIALVEAKRDIPWTKPDDIEIPAIQAEPLPKFGGFAKGSFLAGFADGRVVTIPQAVDPVVLRAFLTVGGRERFFEEDLLQSKLAEPKQTRKLSPREQHINHLKQIVAALVHYEAAHRFYPRAASRDTMLRPLLSWRVAILPHLEGGETLYREFNLNEPWDSEHNRKLIDKMPDVFRDPTGDPKSTDSVYFMITGKGTFGDLSSRRNSNQLVDGASSTIMIVDAKCKIPWTKPEDIEVELNTNRPLRKLGGIIDGVFVGGFADGSVRTLAKSIDADTLRGLFSVAGGEFIDIDAVAKQSETQK